MSTLHLAIPALEALHKAWSSRADRPKYARFADALNTACNKIDKYYEKTTESAAYLVAMSVSYCFLPMTLLMNLLVLNPKGKMLYFKKHWPEELHENVLKYVEAVVSSILHIPISLFNVNQFKERYLRLAKETDHQMPTPHTFKKKGLHMLLRELSDDEEMFPRTNQIQSRTLIGLGIKNFGHMLMRLSRFQRVGPQSSGGG